MENIQGIQELRYSIKPLRPKTEYSIRNIPFAVTGHQTSRLALSSLDLQCQAGILMAGYSKWNIRMEYSVFGRICL